VEQATALLRAGIAAGRLHPRLASDRLVAILDAQLAQEPAATGFLEPFTRFPSRIGAADRERLAARGREELLLSVRPALQSFRAFLAGEYRDAAPEEGGLSRQGGSDLYRYLVRHHTTTEMAPAEIHERGLAEVARIRGEMEAVKRQAAFPGSMPEFFDHLRTDPRFYHADGPSLLTAYRSLAKSVDPRLVRLFGRLPQCRTAWSPPGAEPRAAFVCRARRSRAGTLVNLYRRRSLVGDGAPHPAQAVPTTPQISLAAGDRALALPPPRLLLRVRGGWALYAGGSPELGLYRIRPLRPARLGDVAGSASGG
jgi:uncharacterized protein (DUF885 family)